MRTFELLLVEDSRADAVIVCEILSQLSTPIQVTISETGRQALDLLRARSENPNARYPDLILLDLNLPEVNGIEVLEFVKGDASLREIPVVIFTSTKRRSEIQRCYRGYANGFMVKPVDLQELRDKLGSLVDFWFKTTELPGDRGSYHSLS